MKLIDKILSLKKAERVSLKGSEVNIYPIAYAIVNGEIYPVFQFVEITDLPGGEKDSKPFDLKKQDLDIEV